MGRSKKRFLIGILVYVSIMIIVYFGVTFYFNDKFYAGTTINGLNCTGKTAEQIERTLARSIENYTITIITKDDNRERIQSSQFAYTYVPDGSIQMFKEEQNPFFWPIAFMNNQVHALKATTTYDEELLRTQVSQLACLNGENIVLPQDAEIILENGKYIIKEAVAGNLLYEEKVYALVKEAVDNNVKEINLYVGDCYVKPEVMADSQDLMERVAFLNKYLDIYVTYDFGDRVETLDAGTIAGWITIGDDNKVTVDETLAAEYVDMISVKYNTFGVSRSFLNSYGQYIIVKGGDYGWLIKRPAEVWALIEIIEAGEPVDGREPVYIQEGLYREVDDVGNTYVEIDYTNQRMWYYKDGVKLVDTPVVTGKPSNGNASPTGTFPIVFVESNYKLKGEDYEELVSFWMPFYGNVGIHDAPWRTEFGSDIYKYKGSHGCINTPYEAAKTIHSNIVKGTPVICYGE